MSPLHSIPRFFQIYLLACNKPKKSTTALFRLQMNCLNGPLLAFMFPETDSRQLPLEASIYWIQHALMCIIPIYLLRYGGNSGQGHYSKLVDANCCSILSGVYNMEAMNDFTWNVIGYAIIILYHYIVLQIVAIVSIF